MTDTSKYEQKIPVCNVLFYTGNRRKKIFRCHFISIIIIRKVPNSLSIVLVLVHRYFLFPTKEPTLPFFGIIPKRKKIIHADNRHVSSNIFDIFFLVFCSPDIFFFFLMTLTENLCRFQSNHHNLCGLYEFRVCMPGG